MSSENNTGGTATEKTNSAPARSSRARKIKVLTIAAGVLLLALAGSYPLYLRLASFVSTDDAFVEGRVVSISPKVAGHVARVLVADNQRVEQGQVLVEVEARDFEVALDIAQARMQSAQAAGKQAEALVSAARDVLAQKQALLSSSHAELGQLQADAAEVEAGKDRDENDLGRMRQMVDAGAVSKQEYEHVRAQAAMSRAKLDSARKQVDTQSAMITQAQASVSAAEDELLQAQALVDVRAADLREAEAEVAKARLDLSYARITAPCSGYVTKKAVEAGAYVQVGQKLLSIVSSDVWFIANFKETQIADMKPGQPVEIKVDAYPGVTFAGRVESIQYGTGSRFTLLPPDNASGNFIKVVQRVPVKIVLDSPEDARKYLLAPGMSVVPRVNVSGDGSRERLAKSTTAREMAAQ